MNADPPSRGVSFSASLAHVHYLQGVLSILSVLEARNACPITLGLAILSTSLSRSTLATISFLNTCHLSCLHHPTLLAGSNRVHHLNCADAVKA